MSVEERVDRLLSDRAGVPWVEPPAGLRDRTLAQVRGGVPRPGRLRVWMPIAAAACIVGSGLAVVVMVPGGSKKPAEREMAVRLDPAPLLGSALREFTASAEESMQAEAKEFLDDADRLTRRVVAQLPFTR